MTINRILCGVVVLMGIVACNPVVANAFCLINGTNIQLHSQSLDSTAFQVDIPPGQRVCCDDCLKNGRTVASLLVVTDYVPVSQNSRPGWKAECRFQVSATGQAVVTGNSSHISCAVGPS
ncbi:MAG: hypothetical protein HQL77_00455 [Magnetococcales bacterium]|nr:hypothetical protein [Magnetococcales bacterium]MBF0418886.1 hypothetical protein [Magnetococcales bacterium]MBF0433823.1 hypothetical protein [Magnetococcales bacterium]